jgi:hypothetical protein
MTREEVLDMPAGREMDVLIAENVMGWAEIREEKYQGERVVAGRPPSETRLSFVPFYSTDIAAAWEVIEKFDFMKLTKSFGVKGVVWIVKMSDGTEVFENSASLAICRAALLATIGDND